MQPKKYSEPTCHSKKKNLSCQFKNFPFKKIAGKGSKDDLKFENTFW